MNIRLGVNSTRHSFPILLCPYPFFPHASGYIQFSLWRSSESRLSGSELRQEPMYDHDDINFESSHANVNDNSTRVTYKIHHMITSRHQMTSK